MSVPTQAPIAAPTIPGPDRSPRTPRFQLPAGACDCHAHLFGPQARYPFDPSRRYTPPDATLSDYVQVLKALGVSRGVLVQPSVYMTDNRLILDALGEQRFPLRAVVVCGPEVSDAELERMHALGVRGVRLNLRHAAGVSGDIAPRMAERIAPFGWHLQFRINPDEFVTVGPIIEALPVDTVIDHMGQIPTAQGIDSAPFQAILRLVEGGRCWVKLSAAYRMGTQPHPYPDVAPFARALVEANPDRMVWATDWPHTTLTKPMPNDGDLCDLLADWIPDEATRHKVLVDNPARLYGFTE
ncbi:MAG: amidohydrolase family protein [Proteobacteria bacterium]|nr:amidohydrolase family protein [Burkholderiales bacterium]